MLKNIKYSILFFLINIFVVNIVTSSDCAYQSVSEKYLKSEIVMLCKIKKAIKYPINKIAHKWTYELIESFKGVPLDTIIGNTVFGRLGFKEGDEVLIYGSSYKYPNTIFTNICKGNRVMRSKKNIISTFELKALRYHKKYIGERIDATPIKYDTKIRTLALNSYRGEFLNIRTKNKNCRAAFVRIKFSSNGNVEEIKFLNRVKRKVKKSILKTVKEDKWITKEDNLIPQEIIRCFLYPPKKLDFIDF